MFNLKWSSILSIATILATSTVVKACPGIQGFSLWRWNEIQWEYSGSHSTTGISNAGGNWNSFVGYRITIDPPGSFRDIQISDDDSIAPNLGNATVRDQGNDPGCYLKQDACDGWCFNTGVAFDSQIRLNFNGIDPETGEPANLTETSARFGVSIDQGIERTTTHEFGHILDVSNDNSALYSCAAPTIMNSNADWNCNLYAPQQCDVSEMLSAYSSWSIYTYCQMPCVGSCS